MDLVKLAQEHGCSLTDMSTGSPRESPHLPCSSGPLWRSAISPPPSPNLHSCLPLNSHLLVSMWPSLHQATGWQRWWFSVPAVWQEAQTFDQKCQYVWEIWGWKLTRNSGTETWCRSPGLTSYTTAHNICVFSSLWLTCFAGGVPGPLRAFWTPPCTTQVCPE